MRVIETAVFKFDELSDAAKQKAIESNRNWNIEGFDWFDSVYETYSAFLAILGADCELTQGKTRDGKTIWNPSIYFTGFWSQGDGASFDCNYSFKKGALALVKKEFPKATSFHDYVRRLNKIQKRVFYSAECRIRRSGHYYHAQTMNIDLQLPDSYGQETFSNTESDILEVFRDIAVELYRDLGKEYEYLTSDESVSDSLIMNECEFTAEGKLI